MPIEYAFVPCFIAEGLEKSMPAFGEDNAYYRRIKKSNGIEGGA